VLFKDIKGQADAVSFLEASLKNGRIANAYIFCGPRGVGKFLAAVNFAKAIVGTDMERHPDIFILKPEKEGANIKIDAVRELIKDIYLKPFQAQKKVCIIDEAQQMKHEAANALLKTLEEPPANSVLILVTDDLNALFSTIVSRSQVVRFYPLKSREIKDILINEHGLDGTKAHVLSRLSGGRLGEAVKYKDDDMFQRRNSIIDGVSKLPRAGLSFEDMPKDKARLYLNILLAWFGDILSAKAGADESVFVNIDKKDIIFAEARRLGFDHLEDVINSIVMTLSYLDQNANAKLALSVLDMKICEV
jgi:DNA polymerase-3 subunit delta'